jgi:hypothetical protein
MAWLELHQAVWTHRKTFELAALLGIDETYAAAHVIRLWSWALDNAPDGDLGRLSDRAIAFGAGWRHEVSLFVGSLVKAGWLDDDRAIHDWAEYAGRLVERRRIDAERKRNSRGPAPDVRGTSNGTAAGVRRTVPDPTGPDSTGPDTTGAHTPNPPPAAREVGTFPVDVEERLAMLPDDLDAAAFHAAAEAALGSLGFTCWREVRLSARGDGQGGRLDIVAERHGVRIALELDDRTPRRKSLVKLGQTDCTFRVVVLRCPYAPGVTSSDGGIVVIGAGRKGNPRGSFQAEPGPAWEPKPGRAVGARGETPDGASEVPLLPPTEEDLHVWDAAGAAASADMTPGNAALLAQLRPVGRAVDTGGLCLRAPPEAGDLGRFAGVLRAALREAGDDRASAARIL